MKLFILALAGLFSSPAFAKGLEAMYFVPVSQDLAPFSRFNVKIDEPYVGTSSNTLAYTFPEELTGSPALSVQLKRTPGTVNDWESPVMRASCAELEKTFTCNMYLVKTPAGNLVAPLSVDNTAKVLSLKNLSPTDFAQQLLVVEKFLSSEPAGILTYKFN
jgi:hypothetical protein